MIIDLNQLSYKDKIQINDSILFDETYTSNVVRGLEDVFASGYIKLNDIDEYVVNLNVTGSVKLLDTVTLDEVKMPIDFVIDDNLDVFVINNENMLDLTEFLWQNIVLEVPIRYTKSDAEKLSGNNWKVVSENQEDEIDPRMQKLYDLYKGGE